MATRSRIGIETSKGVFDTVYCHFDGYLEGVGKILDMFYSDREKARQLINLGDISSLDVNIDPNPEEEHSFNNSQSGVCLFYGRDRGDKDTNFITETIEKLLEYKRSGIEYVYIYRLDDTWEVFDTYNSYCENFVSLTKALDEA